MKLCSTVKMSVALSLSVMTITPVRLQEGRRRLSKSRRRAPVDQQIHHRLPRL
jgi:hypothetical protein